jgi:hypothetical protein
MAVPDPSARVLARLPATSGTAHFPGSPRAWTYASGAAELALAAGIALPLTRR